jgi:hypothetical protein
MRTRTRPLARALAAALLLPAAAAHAQPGAPTIEPAQLGPATRDGEPRFQGGINFSIGSPRGEFRTYVADGYGVGLHGLGRVGRDGWFALRLDGGFLQYGRERKRVPLSETVGGRLRVDLTTSNNIVWLGAGPQLMAPRGPVRPYVNGTVGFSYFATTSSIQGRDDDEPIAQDTNYDDAQLSWGGGGGVLVPVYRNARTLVFLDLGARYHDNGRNVRYLRKGGIRDLPDGRIELDVIQSRADLVTWHIGVSVGGR